MMYNVRVAVMSGGGQSGVGNGATCDAPVTAWTE